MLCWSHIPNCWKSHALAQIKSNQSATRPPLQYGYLQFVPKFNDYIVQKIMECMTHKHDNFSCADLTISSWERGGHGPTFFSHQLILALYRGSVLIFLKKVSKQSGPPSNSKWNAV